MAELVNRNKLDDRISNSRVATVAENNANRSFKKRARTRN
jgi:hypothetical protein